MVITSKLNRKVGCNELIMPYKARTEDKLNNELLWAEGEILELGKQQLRYEIPFEKKPIMHDLHLVLTFISNSGKKTVISYNFVDASKCSLGDVFVTDMSELEKRLFVQALANTGQKKEKPNDGFSNNLRTDDNVAKEEEEYEYTAPEIEQYISALRKEKYFLKQEGGRQYKVTNGKLVGSKNGIFSYIFELETELHLADDAPITLSAGAEEASGTVLMCEDFQIIVLIDKNVGERVLSARINVEPWKLLESLEKRICHNVKMSGPITQKLIKEGPKLATKDSIENIAKGQPAVIDRSQNEPITIVWGPPGTGKTHTMSEIAISFLKQGKSVLMVSHSNVSVDGVAKKIYELLKSKGADSLFKSGKVLRYGYVRDEELAENEYISSFKYAVKRCPQLDSKLEELQKEYNEIKRTKGIGNQKIVELHQAINKIRNQIREEEKSLVDKASVVATTISKVIIDKIFEDRLFDVVMFDEVSMAYVPQIISASTFAKKHLICVGDFMQLEPIVQSGAKDILCQDIFAFLGINVKGIPYYHPWLVMLDEQRRMHPMISAFANKYVYQGLLKDHETVRHGKDNIVKAPPLVGKPINYIDLTGSYCASSKNQDNSRFNILSAVVSFSMAVQGEKNMNPPEKGKVDERVSIITPYAAQTRLVRALVQDYREHYETSVRCATVHQFQGSESNMILFDAVESYPGAKVGFLMGKDMNSIKRLINVAVTRARGKLVTVGNGRFWENAFKGTNHTFYKLQQYLFEKGNRINHKEGSLKDYLDTFQFKGFLNTYFESSEYIESFSDDIKRAKEKIVISLPSGKIEKEYEEVIYKHIYDAKKKGIHVLIKSNDFASLPERWKALTWGTDNAVFPIVMIDDRITWYGVPFADWEFQVDKATKYGTVCKVAIRINGKVTAEMIKSLSNLEFRETAGGITPLLEKEGGILIKSSMNEDEIDDGKGAIGLAAYVENHIKCSVCKKPIKMSKGKSGKTILWCKDCKKTQLLSKDEINHYICVNHVRCPKDGCCIEARLGQWGLYIKCDADHYLKPEEI